MADNNVTNVELNTYSEPPKILAEDEIPPVEIRKLNLPYRKVVK
jgi:hypothetical protein